MLSCLIHRFHDSVTDSLIHWFLNQRLYFSFASLSFIAWWPEFFKSKSCFMSKKKKSPPLVERSFPSPQDFGIWFYNTRRCFISNILAECDSTSNYWAFKEDSVANYNYICISRRLKFQLMRDMSTATSSTLSATLYGVAVTTFKWQLLFPQ